MDSEDQGEVTVRTMEDVVITQDVMQQARDIAFDSANEHRSIRNGVPFEGRAQAIGACQLNMSGMIMASVAGAPLDGPATRLAGAAIYALATHLAVVEKVEQEKRDAAERGGPKLHVEEAVRDGIRIGDSAGINVRRPSPLDGKNNRGIGEDGS